MITAVSPRGLGDIWSSLASGVGSLFSALTGKKTVTVPAECMTFDAATQVQCAQMAAAVKAGQMNQVTYLQWVQEQQTMSTIKKYAPYALLGVGAIVIVAMLRKKD